MGKEGLESLLNQFDDGCGFGDPEARRNAELRLQVLLARQQCDVAKRLNILTLLLVVVGLLNCVIFAFQVWGRG